jgi:acyl-CoA thioesterase-2
MATTNTVLPWDSRDLEALLRLEPVGPSTFRTRYASPNSRGTVYGGQLLANAVMAASLTVPAGRDITALQFMFLQSADPARVIDLEVSVLQDGKRFASRHVRGTQPATHDAPRRVVLDAQATFATPLPGPEHATPAPALAKGIDPFTLPRMEDMPADVASAVWRTLGYQMDSTLLDLRVGDAAKSLGLASQSAELNFWLRTREPLPDDPMLHAAAFAYLSDWWLNFAAVGIHVPQLDRDGERLHVASLNHAIWFHRPLRADRWLCFDVQSPCAARGRGLSVAKVYDGEGGLVASATQECLSTPGLI